jgi:L-lactate utilization protein LutC
VDIDLPEMLLRIRAGSGAIKTGKATREGQGLPYVVKLGLGMFRIAASVPWFFRLAQQVMGILPLPDWIRIPAFTGWGYSKDFPRPVKSFHSRWKALQHEIVNPARAPEQPKTPPAEGKPTSKSVDLVEQFTIELQALGGKVIRVNEKDVSARLSAFLHERGIVHVLVDDAGAEFVSGIPAIREPDPTVRAGVTGALCGIAETGSVVLVSGAGETLKASLLPEIHIALLKISQLVPTVPTAMCKPEVIKAASTVLVSGPSRTADIEMTLTIGVHGPGELHVLLIDDSAGV